MRHDAAAASLRADGDSDLALGDEAISHPYARALALCWEDSSRPDFSITVLARTGAIRSDIETQLARDLNVLTHATGDSRDSKETTAQVQVRQLLRYVRQHGPRPAPPGWMELPDDGQFLTVMEQMVAARFRAPGSWNSGGESYVSAVEYERPSGSPATRAPQQASAEAQGATAYELIGGAPAVRAAVDLFYKNVLGDHRVAHYFEGISIARLKAHQRAMITAVTGGSQEEYADMQEAHERLRAAHEHLRIVGGDFDIVVGHLVSTLSELGVPDNLIRQLAPKILALREDVVTETNYQPVDEQEEPVTMPTNAGTSVYERIGGAAAVKAAVELFYNKVLGDHRVAHFFEGINIARLKAHQRAMITAVAGGPNQYSGRSMHEAHQHLNINGQDFDIVVGHLVATLQELNVPEEDIDLVAPKVLALRDDIAPA